MYSVNSNGFSPPTNARFPSFLEFCFRLASLPPIWELTSYMVFMLHDERSENKKKRTTVEPSASLIFWKIVRRNSQPESWDLSRVHKVYAGPAFALCPPKRKSTRPTELSWKVSNIKPSVAKLQEDAHCPQRRGAELRRVLQHHCHDFGLRPLLSKYQHSTRHRCDAKHSCRREASKAHLPTLPARRSRALCGRPHVHGPTQPTRHLRPPILACE